jgi:hypothetical protein
MKTLALAAAATLACAAAGPAAAASILTVKTVAIAHQTGHAATTLGKTELNTIRTSVDGAQGGSSTLDILPDAFGGDLPDWTATLFAGTLNVAKSDNYSFNLSLLKNVSGGYLKVDGSRVDLSAFNLGGSNNGGASVWLDQGAHSFEAFFVKKGGAAHGGFTGRASGANAGSLTFSPLAAAVPEPTSWALMIGGFALVGGAARYRRRGTTVTYA